LGQLRSRFADAPPHGLTATAGGELPADVRTGEDGEAAFGFTDSGRRLHRCGGTDTGQEQCDWKDAAELQSSVHGRTRLCTILARGNASR